ncbi:MAG: diaminopimelate epimerase [Thalassobaculales bacterium]
MGEVSFLKMHGLGNDFVVLDGRAGGFRPGPAAARAIGDRRTGVGFDQLLVIEPPEGGADIFLRFLNSDGSEAGACGNGTRCVAAHILEESGGERVSIATVAGTLTAWRAGRDAAGEPLYTVDMGPPRLGWRDIPVAGDCDTLHLPVAEGGLADPVGVSMGNPHAVFFVDDAEAVALEELGPRLERHPFFPDRANIEVVQVLSRDVLRMRVWERGAGITRACGSGACATQVAAVRRGVADRRATVWMDGGPLQMEWREADGHVLMTGPVAVSFAGTLHPRLLAAD